MTPPLSVFIVEDEAIVANDIAETLKSLGYAVAGTAKSGENAVEKILQVHPDLVLMDIHLAGTMDGVETAAEVHKASDVPVIYLTAYADKALLDRAKLTQPYGYLIKPYDDRELQSVIEMASYKYRMDRLLRESREQLRVLNEELESRVARRTAALRDQVTFLQQLIDTVPAPVYYKDRAGVYLGCNNAFEAYTGIRRQDVSGKTDAALFSSDMAALSTEKDSQIISRPGIQVYQAKFSHADHTLRDVIFKKATFSSTDGGTGGLIGVMIDISDRVAAEEALRACEEKFLLIMEDLEVLVYRCTPEKTCTYANPALLRFFGRNAADTIGYVFSLPLPPDDAAMLKKRLDQLTAVHPKEMVSFRVVLPGGRERTVRFSVRAIFDTTGQVREYLYVGCSVPE